MGACRDVSEFGVVPLVVEVGCGSVLMSETAHLILIATGASESFQWKVELTVPNRKINNPYKKKIGGISEIARI